MGLTIDPTTGVISGTVDHLASQANTNGQYPVTIFADDGNGGLTQQTFTWTIVNDPPAAVNHTQTTPLNTAVAGNASVGATDPNSGDVLTYTQASNPSHGTVAFNANGTYIYTPTTGFTGTDTFTYTVDDGKGGTATRTETIVIAPSLPTAPVAVNDSYTTPFNTPVSGAAATGDTFAPGSTFTATSVPAHGTVAMNTDGTYTYTPTAGFTGTDTFTYQVTDAAGQVSTATETIKVGTHAVDDGYTTPVNTPVAGVASTADTYPAGSTFPSSQRAVTSRDCPKQGRGAARLWRHFSAAR